MTKQRMVLAAMSDLFFTVQIQDAARRADVGALLANTEAEALSKAGESPAVIFIDLNAATFDSVELIRKLKSNQSTRGSYVVGFVSHVQVDLGKRAQEAGCDQVLARSAFAQNLPVILNRFLPS